MISFANDRYERKSIVRETSFYSLVYWRTTTEHLANCDESDDVATLLKRGWVGLYVTNISDDEEIIFLSKKDKYLFYERQNFINHYSFSLGDYMNKSYQFWFSNLDLLNEFIEEIKLLPERHKFVEFDIKPEHIESIKPFFGDLREIEGSSGYGMSLSDISEDYVDLVKLLL